MSTILLLALAGCQRDGKPSSDDSAETGAPSTDSTSPTNDTGGDSESSQPPTDTVADTVADTEADTEADTAAPIEPSVAVWIEPEQPGVDDTLTCHWLVKPDSAVDSSWRVGEASQGSAEFSLSSVFSRDDVITCSIEALFDDGSIHDSAAVQILNSPPTVSSVTISPAVPVAGEPLTAVVAAVDPDGDLLTHEWEWFADGALAGDSEELTGDSVTSGAVITAQARSDDGEAISAWLSSPAVVVP